MAETLRLGELMAALSLATDLGMGQPLEQAVRTCLVSVAIGDRVGLRDAELSDVYYTALLRFLGCTADAHEMAEMVGGDEIAIRAAIAPVLGGAPREFAGQVMPRVGEGRSPLRRAGLVIGMMTSGRGRAREGLVAHCEVAANLAQRLGLSPGVHAGLANAFEQWNGQGMPGGVAGDAIPLAARIVFLARDLEVLDRLWERERLVAALRARRGAAYDPELVDAAIAHLDDVLAALGAPSVWEAVLEAEPEPRPWVPEARLEAVLEAFADFVDLKSPYTAGHSRGVSELAASSSAPEGRRLRRAGLVHDLGRVSVPNGIWDKPARLSEGEWERVRLHPYYSERILSRVAALEPLARLAGMHHERQDGTGYHRGSAGADIPPEARLLAAADAYQAMTQPRPHRGPKTPPEAAQELEMMAAAGRLDREAVHAVLTAAGHAVKPGRAAWPAGLSDREVEVLRLICRGSTKSDVARALSISASTVDHHVRHIYEKAGVQTRAGVTLFALEHDLLR